MILKTGKWSRNTYIQIGRKRNKSRMYKYPKTNRNGGRNLDSDFMEETEYVITGLKRGESVGFDKIAAETFIANKNGLVIYYYVSLMR